MLEISDFDGLKRLVGTAALMLVTACATPGQDDGQSGKGGATGVDQTHGTLVQPERRAVTSCRSSALLVCDHRKAGSPMHCVCTSRAVF